MKKALSMLLALALCLSLFGGVSLSAFADGDDLEVPAAPAEAADEPAAPAEAADEPAAPAEAADEPTTPAEAADEPTQGTDVPQEPEPVEVTDENRDGEEGDDQAVVVVDSEPAEVTALGAAPRRNAPPPPPPADGDKTEGNKAEDPNAPNAPNKPDPNDSNKPDTNDPNAPKSEDPAVKPDESAAASGLAATPEAPSGALASVTVGDGEKAAGFLVVPKDGKAGVGAASVSVAVKSEPGSAVKAYALIDGAAVAIGATPAGPNVTLSLSDVPAEGVHVVVVYKEGGQQQGGAPAPVEQTKENAADINSIAITTELKNVSELPDGLKNNPDTDTVAKIEQALITKATEGGGEEAPAAPPAGGGTPPAPPEGGKPSAPPAGGAPAGGVDPENVVVLEVEKLVLADKDGNPIDRAGKPVTNEADYVELKPADIPREGATFVLAYPDAVKADYEKYEFIVLHMFSADFVGPDGKVIAKAGDIEILTEVEKTPDGLKVTVKSLSPFAIAWKDIAGKAEAGDNKTGAGQSGGKGGNPPPPPPGGKPGGPGGPPPGGKPGGPGGPPPGGKPGDPPPGGKPGEPAPAADVYEVGGLKIHPLPAVSGEASGEPSGEPGASGEMKETIYIIESEDALIGIGIAKDEDAEKAWKDLVEELDKPLEGIIITDSEDAAPAAELAAVYAVWDVADAVEDEDIELTVISAQEGAEIAGIRFELAENGDVVLPDANIAYTTIVGGEAGTSVEGLEELKEAGYDLILVPTGNPIEAGEIDGLIEALRTPPAEEPPAKP